ncbi:hypothetical protein BG015_000757 [Linnemannia schmuckeri]|uniref:Domain of unknown function at the cortex 1 domain-containing protein n=1 Tax=Linnemannia schmuckeri TaxID=64567 RepID=A0A9P5V7E6_9FUNG|nr:hypothetical protein BG015_000757 [Linnemannia schmuckeri]
MVKLRVSVGGSYTDLAIINPNDELHPFEFDTPEFKGRAVIRIKDFVGITNDGSAPIYSDDYFKGHNRKFSIQVEGRFKREWGGEQVYFGTDFDRSVELPHGFETMLRVARYIDPVVKTSLTKDSQPWILSPLVSSINTLAAWRPKDANLPSPPLTPRQSTDIAHALNMSESSSMWGFLGKLKRGNRSSVTSASSHTSHDVYDSQPASANNSTDQLESSQHSHGNLDPSLSSSSSSSDWPNGSTPTITTTENAHDDSGMPLGKWRPHVEEDTTFFMNKAMTTAQRRKYFQTEEARKQFVFRTDLVHGFEFFSPHMDFNTFDIHMGLSMNIRKYLTGQPVRYTCRTLAGDVVFWAVQFELVE